MSKTNYGHPYFETVSEQPGLNRLKHNTCGVIDFSLLVLKAGESHTFNTAGREYGLVIMSGGPVSIQVGEHAFNDLQGRASVFADKPTMVYAGCNSEVRIQAGGDVEIALCSALSSTPIDPYLVLPADVPTGQWGEGNTKRRYRYMINQDRPSERLWLAEVFVQNGAWATYPPHKHEDVEGDLFQEEMYFYRVDPPHGFGFCGQFEGLVEEDYAFLIRNNTIHKMPFGNHTVTAAPGYRVLYLAVYAGHDKGHRPTAHPDHVNFQDNQLSEDDE